jgi:hypothetical protein
MGIGSPPNPHRDEIRNSFLNGERKCDIARRLGISDKAVYYNTKDLPPSFEINPAKGTMMRNGKLGIKEHLSQEQKRKLEKMAREWGCETLAEAALEILRDALEEPL